MPATEKDRIRKTISALRRRGFDARFAETGEEAKKLALSLIEEDWRIGAGDSATIRSLGILQDLTDSGHSFGNAYSAYYRPKRKVPARRPTATQRERPASAPQDVGYDVFLASANAVTEDGKIVNIDGGGNRTGGIIHGGRRVILVVGRNKIAKDVDEALFRIKNVTCPNHSRTVGSLGALCAAMGRCVEPEVFCEPGARACNIVLILEAAPAMRARDIVVIVVNQDLGLGWDPSWPQERKDRIYAEYRKFTPPHGPIFMWHGVDDEGP